MTASWALSDQLDDLGRLLTKHGDFKPPRSRTLTPLVGENPPVVRGKEDWISAAHGSDSFGEQPQRIEAKR